ncbi:hypothetical protein Hamer_G001506 [Homarus americanus]|uniref:Uncharacterized protein n=1 Tax=Homarus americanus TaxID=6706 RepID=A0A8J5N9T9_HOMAM|nr:hypothetical protein Hamer_G001506 [Homarus americanus]
MTKASQPASRRTLPKKKRTVDTAAITDKLTGVITANPLDTLLLQFGNILGLIDLGGLTPDKITTLGGTAGLGGLTGLGGLGALGGLTVDKITTLGSTLAAVSAVKTSFLDLGAKAIDVVNFVLAIIALALLIVYLVENEGDIKGLYGDTGTGTYRRQGSNHYDSYSGYINTARSFMDAPLMQSVTNFVYDAITKYDD